MVEHEAAIGVEAEGVTAAMAQHWKFKRSEVLCEATRRKDREANRESSKEKEKM